jgi:hypothetical protein
MLENSISKNPLE